MTFIVPALLIFIIAVVAAIVLPPVYRSTSTILIEEQDIPLEYVRATVNTFAEQQLQVINQRIMTTSKLLEIINRLGLYRDVRDSETTEEIVDQMRKDIKLQPISVDVVDPKTGRPTTATIAFSLSYEGKSDPAKVQQVTNILTSLFLDENIKVREEQASGISSFIEEEMNKVKSDLKEIDKQLAEYKQKNINELPELLQVNQQSLNNAEQQKQMLLERLSYLKEREGSLMGELAGTPRDLLDLDKRRLQELKLNLVSLTKKFSKDYPDVITTRQEIEELEKKISNESGASGNSPMPDNPSYVNIDSQLKSIQGEIAAVNAQIANLDKGITEYRSRIGLTPGVESSYSRLLSERNNTQAKYDDLMRKLMEARVSQGLEREQKGERFTLIEPPLLPEKPFKPNRMAIIVIGFVLGCGIGAGTAAAREFLDESVHEPEDLAFISSYPLLAVIPYIPNDQDLSRHNRMRKTVMKMLMIGAVAAFVIILAGIHLFYMHLDILWAKVQTRFGKQ